MNTTEQLQENQVVYGSVLELSDGRRYKVDGVSADRQVRLRCLVCGGKTIYKSMDELLNSAKLLR